MCVCVCVSLSVSVCPDSITMITSGKIESRERVEGREGEGELLENLDVRGERKPEQGQLYTTCTGT